jgi:hypothetical protein
LISQIRFNKAIGLSLVVAIAPLVAQANDCSAPETFYDERKCVSNTIRSLAEALRLQLTRTTDALSPDGKTRIENDQTIWEQAISNYCIGTSEKPVEEIDACLAEHFEDRITTLAFYQSHSLPYPVISRHVFRSQPSSAQIDWIESASYITRFPQIDLGALSGDLLIQAVKINQWLAALTGEEKPSSDSDFSKTIVVNRPLTNIYKAASVVTQYGHGAAHPTYLEERFYFSLSSTGPLKANDLFVDPRWQTILSALTFNYLSANLRDNLWQKTPLELVDLITDTKRWEISRDYLTILFNPYEVASFSDGIQRVSLRWENISGLLTESWKTEVLN